MIAGAFPGLFSFTDLLNLDIRDFDFWFKAAQIKVLNERIDALREFGAAWVDPNSVRDELAIYQNALAELEGTKTIRIESAWEEMKRRGRG